MVLEKGLKEWCHLQANNITTLSDDDAFSQIFKPMQVKISAHSISLCFAFMASSGLEVVYLTSSLHRKESIRKPPSLSSHNTPPCPASSLDVKTSRILPVSQS